MNRPEHSSINTTADYLQFNDRDLQNVQTCRFEPALNANNKAYSLSGRAVSMDIASLAVRARKAVVLSCFYLK